MKKQILNLGKALNKAEQRTINGGASGKCCNPANDCCVPNDGAPRPQCSPPTGGSGCAFLYSTQPCCI